MLVPSFHFKFLIKYLLSINFPPFSRHKTFSRRVYVFLWVLGISNLLEISSHDPNMSFMIKSLISEIPFSFYFLVEQLWVRARGLLFKYSLHQIDLSVTINLGGPSVAFLQDSSSLTCVHGDHIEENTLDLNTFILKSPIIMSQKGMLSHYLFFLITDLSILFLTRTFQGLLPQKDLKILLAAREIPWALISLILHPPNYLGRQCHSPTSHNFSFWTLNHLTIRSLWEYFQASWTGS